MTTPGEFSQLRSILSSDFLSFHSYRLRTQVISSTFVWVVMVFSFLREILAQDFVFPTTFWGIALWGKRTTKSSQGTYLSMRYSWTPRPGGALRDRPFHFEGTDRPPLGSYRYVSLFAPSDLAHVLKTLAEGWVLRADGGARSTSAQSISRLIPFQLDSVLNSQIALLRFHDSDNSILVCLFCPPLCRLFLSLLCPSRLIGWCRSFLSPDGSVAQRVDRFTCSAPTPLALSPRSTPFLKTNTDLCSLSASSLCIPSKQSRCQ